MGNISKEVAIKDLFVEGTKVAQIHIYPFNYEVDFKSRIQKSSENFIYLCDFQHLEYDDYYAIYCSSETSKYYVFDSFEGENLYPNIPTELSSKKDVKNYRETRKNLLKKVEGI